MAETSQDAPASEQPQTWSAEQCEDALAHVERLQEQLDSLRSTIPSLVAPLLRQNASKALMFAGLKKSANQSINELRAFRETWTSEHTQQIFVRARDSAEANGDLGKAEGVARYGWNDEV